MYNKILVPLENSKTDRVVIDHVTNLAKQFSSHVILVHVADGFVARNQQKLNLQDSEEMVADRAYLAACTDELSISGLAVEAVLEQGDPGSRILSVAESKGCDLIAMATHGHRLLGDILLGSVADNIRHRTSIPILMIREARGL